VALASAPLCAFSQPGVCVVADGPVVEEIAPVVRASNEVSDSGDVVIVISADLARSIIRSAGSRP
jgi:hypothetical protein